MEYKHKSENILGFILTASNDSVHFFRRLRYVTVANILIAIDLHGMHVCKRMSTFSGPLLYFWDN